jgi:hypothetical protein
MKPLVQVELKINPTSRFRLTLYGLTDRVHFRLTSYGQTDRQSRFNNYMEKFKSHHSDLVFS